MSFYLARLEAAREQHRMMMAAAAAHAPAPRAWPPYPQQQPAHGPRAWPPYPQQPNAALLPRPEHHPPLPPPLHAAGRSRVVDTWRGAGIVARRDVDVAPSSAGGSLGVGVGSVARRDDGAPSSAGVSGSAPGATAREETGGIGGGELRNKRPLAPTTPRPRSPPPPKRRAVGAAAAARRLFPPGCGRDDAALPLASADGDGGASRHAVAARGGGGGSGAPHQSAPPPCPPALAGAKVVLVEATPSPTAAAAAAAGSSALKKVSASDGAAAVTTHGGGHHCQGERPVNSSEAAGVAGPGNGKLFKSKDGFVPSMRLMPTPTSVSAHRLFPPGCRRLGAPLAAGDGTKPSPEEMVPAERDDKESVVRPGIGTANGAAQNGGSQDGTIPEVLHESQVSSSVVNHDCRGQRIGNRCHCEERSSSTIPATDANVTNKPDGSSCNIIAAESLAQGLSKEGQMSESVSECGALNNTCSDDLAAATAMSGEGAVMRKKVMHTPRKSVRPPKLIQKPLLNTQLIRPFSMAIERETELGWSVNMNDLEDTGVFTKDRAIQDPPISANKSPWTTNGKEADYFGPKKRVSKKKLHKRRFAVKGCARPTMKVASKCASSLGGIEELKDDEIFKALVAHETKFEYGPQSADARSKVKLICNRFESICRAIVQAAGHRSIKVRRIDLAADKLIRKLPGFTKQGPVVGSVPGVEVGDEFLYRVQLALVGLHRPFQGGIDSTSHESGVRIAISVVASGGYPDELSLSSGQLVYTGSGSNGDQKLEHGNLALKNCIGMKTPVRVIHGFKDQNREEGSHSRAKEITTFTYDGLYHVVDCWREGSPGSKVFKYRLQRIPGQPQLSLHRAKAPW